MPSTAEAVTEAASGQHERGEGQRVGIDDPLEVFGAGTEVDDQAGQGDVDQGHVEVDREGAETEGGEDQWPVVHDLKNI